MKLTIREEQLNEAPESFLHHSGWALIHDRRRDVSSFVKRLGSGFYPRLHLYVDSQNGLVTFNMHLDQKETSYKGGHMHSAEYDNELVVGEIAAIKASLGIDSGATKTQTPVTTPDSSVSISKPQYNQSNFAADLAELKSVKPKTFWQRLLGL